MANCSFKKFALPGTYLIGLSIYADTSVAQNTTSSAVVIDPTLEKVLVAVVSAVLSLIAGYILIQLKERREPRKRLSYDLETRHGLVGVDDAISRNISLLYKNRPAEKLTYVRFDLKNTGNTVVKAELIRFEFPKESQVLDAYTEPPPPKEYGVVEVSDTTTPAFERQFRIAHLEKQQKVGLRFVLAGAANSEPKVHPFNEAGDVEFTAASISRAADDRQVVEQFIYLFILSIIVPPTFQFLPGIFRDVALALAYALLGFAMLPLLKPVSRVISGALAALSQEKEATVSIDTLVQNPNSAIAISTGHGESHIVLRTTQEQPLGNANPDA